MEYSFRARPVYLIPILASLLFGLLCASLGLTSQVGIYEITPFPEGIGSFGNGLYFVVLAGVGASLVYLLLKRKNIKLVALITGFALTAAVFMLSLIYLSATFSLVVVPYSEALILILSICISALVDYAVFRARGRISSLAVLCLGGALGAFLGISIPALSAILILVFLAVYDVFAVYHGPVGKIAHGGLERLRGLSFSFIDVQMGLGDLTFYSMLISSVLANADLVYCVASVAGVLAGVFIGFKMLERRGMFPGLPFPILLGLSPLLIWFFR